MDRTPFQRYRPKLAALASEEGARAAIERAGIGEAQPGATVQWRSLFGRFYPDTQPYALQVFESIGAERQVIARVEAFETPPCSPLNAELWSSPTPIGFLRVTSLAADAALPALVPLLEGDGAATVTVVRYHPGLRCTVRVLRQDRVLYGKLFHDDRGREIGEDCEQLWRASAAGEIRFDVARPLAWDGAQRTLWQEKLPGHPVRPHLVSQEGPLLAARIGEALGSLAASAVRPCRVFTAREQMDRSIRHGAELVARVPDLEDEVRAFLDLLGAYLLAVEPHAPRPVHGAPSQAQWLVTSERLGLLDFDRFAAGDPELDVGTLLADLDFEHLPSEIVRGMEAAVISGWRASATHLDRALVEFYRGHCHLRKALRKACAIQPDADERAARSLRRSRQLLERREIV
jgi:phosphotransferase family enzyme